MGAPHLWIYCGCGWEENTRRASKSKKMALLVNQLGKTRVLWLLFKKNVATIFSKIIWTLEFVYFLWKIPLYIEGGIRVMPSSLPSLLCPRFSFANTSTMIGACQVLCWLSLLISFFSTFIFEPNIQRHLKEFFMISCQVPCWLAHLPPFSQLFLSSLLHSPWIGSMLTYSFSTLCLNFYSWSFSMASDQPSKPMAQ